MSRTTCACVVILGSVGWPAALAAQQTAQSAPAGAASEPLRTAGDRPADIRHVRLDLQVDLPKKTVDGTATLSVRAMRDLSSLSLDAVEFEVQKVWLQGEGEAGRYLNFDHDGRKLVIDFEGTWPAGRDGTLRIEYRVREPREGLFFFGPTKAEPNVPLQVWSQGEAITNRYWFPCLDQPNQKQTTELVVTAAEGNEVISNGKLVGRKENPDHTVTFHWKEEHPHPSYLVTLVVGQFDVVRDEWEGLPVLYYVPKGAKGDVERTFGRTKEMLWFFSDRFGIRYPWEKYAQVVVEQFTSGGMENTSATTLTTRAFHDARAILDSTPDGLISHELAHQWWGDMVTCKDWAHLWLNEGFASYFEAVWAEHHLGREEFEYNMLLKARQAMAGDKERPVVDRRYPFERSMFDARSYPKGAWLLHMLRRQLGDEAFWRGLKRYGTAFRFQSAETGDFREVLENETGRSLERFFYDWAERPGHPVLEVRTDYLPETRQTRLTVKQTQPGEAFHFPLRVVFHNKATARPGSPGEPMRAQDFEVTEKEQTFLVGVPERPALVEVDPQQALLAEIKETKANDLWVAQLKNGGVAARVRAARQLGTTKLPADRQALAEALGQESFWGVRAEIAGALGESGGDAARDALLAGLKAEHAKVRRACAEQLGQFKGDARAAAGLKQILQKGDPSYFVEAAAVGAYAKVSPADAAEVVRPWLGKESHNDVIRVAALGGLAHAADPSAVDTLLAWTKRGKPPSARAGALAAVGQWARDGKGTPEQSRRAVQELEACLNGEGMLVRASAVAALQAMGRGATSALPAIYTLARQDPNLRVREQARRAAEQIRAAASATGDTGQIREELDRLRRDNDALRQRLDRLEKARTSKSDSPRK